jgi:hypothetical protein
MLQSDDRPLGIGRLLASENFGDESSAKCDAVVATGRARRAQGASRSAHPTVDSEVSLVHRWPWAICNRHPDWLGLGGRGLPTVEVAAPAPAVRLGSELPL